MGTITQFLEEQTEGDRCYETCPSKQICLTPRSVTQALLTGRLPQSPSHIFFIFLHSYYHTCYCLIYLCVHFFSVCLPTECKPWGRDSAHLVTAVFLPGEQHLEPGGPSVFVTWTDGRGSATCLTTLLSKVYPIHYLLLSFLLLRNAQPPFPKPQTPISDGK